jgi:hypothetical protein
LREPRMRQKEIGLHIDNDGGDCQIILQSFHDRVLARPAIV